MYAETERRYIVPLITFTALLCFTETAGLWLQYLSRESVDQSAG
jgi:hypothetical protein